MKTILSFLILICLYLPQAIGQPVFSWQLPAPGYISNNQYFVVPNADAGAAGPNQTWSFTLPDTGIPAPAFEFVLPSATPFPDSFPTSTLASKATISQGPVEYQIYSFYKVAGNVAEEVGTIFISSLSSVITRYSNPETIAGFSLTYNQSLTDAYYNITKQFGGGTSLFQDTTLGTKTFKYDGYGSISTPQGFFGNVVRLREYKVSNSLNSIFDANRSTTYSWIKAGPVQIDPIFSLTIDSTRDLEGNVIIEKNAIMPNQITEVNEVISGSQISAYPNPVTDQLNIKYVQAAIKPVVILYDVHGKVIDHLLIQHAPNLIQIPTADLPSGLYVATLSQGDGVQSSRFAKN